MADLVTGLMAFATLIAGLATLLWRAKSRGAAEERARQAQRERDDAEATKRRMQNATADLGHDPDVLRDWLRTRGLE